jgi:translation initiation factor eIF-2B subunit epsilon
MEWVNFELPACLFPVCNAPSLLYVLHWLSVNEIARIYLLCRADHGPFLRRVIAQCEERLLMRGIAVVEAPLDDRIYTIGDSLRWIARWNRSHAVIGPACLIVQGTLITNIPLAGVLAKHSESGGSLTTVWTRSASGGYAVVLNADDMILSIQRPAVLSLKIETKLTLSSLFFRDSKVVRIRTGLYDPRIVVCTDGLLEDFARHPDWHSVVGDCIPSGTAAYAAIVPSRYAAVVDDLPEYLDASLAVVRRWLHPLTVEANVFNSLPMEPITPIVVLDDILSSGEVTSYRLERELVYLHDNVFPDLTAKVVHSVVGSGSTIGPRAVIRDSTVGSRCEIGAGAVVTNSVLWDNVRVSDNAVIDHTLVASFAVVDPGVHIAFGCLISFSSRVETDLPPCRRVGQAIDFPAGREPWVSDFAPVRPWLKAYLEERPPLDMPKSSGTIEYELYSEEHELPLLRMW